MSLGTIACLAQMAVVLSIEVQIDQSTRRRDFTSFLIERSELCNFIVGRRPRRLDHKRRSLPSSSPQSSICTETVHNARYLAQPLLWSSGMVSLGMKRLFDFLKIHSCTFERERKVKKHVVTCARLPF